MINTVHESKINIITLLLFMSSSLWAAGFNELDRSCCIMEATACSQLIITRRLSKVISANTEIAITHVSLGDIELKFGAVVTETDH